MIDNEQKREVFIRCVRVGDIAKQFVTPTTTIVKCAFCEHDIYICESSVKASKEMNARAICAQCVDAAFPAFIRLPMTEEQEREKQENAKRIYNN